MIVCKLDQQNTVIEMMPKESKPVINEKSCQQASTHDVALERPEIPILCLNKIHPLAIQTKSIKEKSTIVHGENSKLEPLLSPHSTKDIIEPCHSQIETPKTIFNPNLESIALFETTLTKIQSFALKDNLEEIYGSEKRRAEVIDWMIDTLSNLKQKERTVFKALYISDLYLQKKKMSYCENNIHLIGAASILIASKHEEVTPVSLDSLLAIEFLNQLNRQELMDEEIEILSTIEFRIHFPSIYELAQCTLGMLREDNGQINDQVRQYATIIMKMSLLSYEILNSFTSTEITAFSLILAFQIVEDWEYNVKAREKVFLIDCSDS